MELKNAIKYFKTKFFRALVGILKTTQHSTGTYKFVPLEVIYDDTIDWSDSVENLDKCLYKKYDLTEKEITFLDNKVQKMDL